MSDAKSLKIYSEYNQSNFRSVLKQTSLHVTCIKINLHKSPRTEMYLLKQIFFFVNCLQHPVKFFHQIYSRLQWNIFQVKRWNTVEQVCMLGKNEKNWDKRLLDFLFFSVNISDWSNGFIHLGDANVWARLCRLSF